MKLNQVLLVVVVLVGQGWDVAAQDACNDKYTSKSQCLVDKSCVWCVAKAVPSECVTKEDAARLPPGVFDCSVGKSEELEDEEEGDLEITLDFDPSKNSANGNFPWESFQARNLRVEENAQDQNNENLCDTSVRQVAGYFHLHNANKHYFFWFFESRIEPEKSPMVAWASGGPGCSDMLALLVENGPCKVTENADSTVLNPFSWNSNANLLYVDSPPGTGFSYGTHDVTNEQVGKDLYKFLILFMSKFPKYQALDFHYFAESYGGFWAPYTAKAIVAGNKEAKESVPKINLRSISIGNGLTVPEIQVLSYAKMAYNSTTAPQRVSLETFEYMDKIATPVAHAAIKACNTIGTRALCGAAQEAWAAGLMLPFQATGYNHYDMRIPCDVPGLCYSFDKEAVWLNDKTVKKKLGVKGFWTSCNPGVTLGFIGEEMRNADWVVADLLEAGIKVQLYAGDVDYICNWIGNKMWALALDWPGQAGFQQAPDEDFMFEGKRVGRIRSHANFTFFQIFQAGHLSPMDQPEVTLEMVRRFTQPDQ